MANWLKEKIKKTSYRAFLITCAVGFVLVLAVFFYMAMLISNSREYKENMNRKADFRANQIVAQVDERLSILESYYISAFEEDEVEWILKNRFTYSDYSRYKPVIDIIGGRKLFYDYIAGFYLDNFTTGVVISNEGILKSKEFSNHDVLEQLYLDAFNRGERRFWRYEPETSTGKDLNKRENINTEGLSLVFTLPIESLNTTSMGVIKINKNTYTEWITELLESGENVVVIAPDGNIIYSTDPSLDETTGRIAADPDSQDKLQDDKAASYATSSILGWKYYVYEDLTGNPFSATSDGMIMTGVLLLLVGLMLSVMLSLFYRPVSGLVREISGSENNGAVGNEFDLISSHMSSLKNNNEALSKLVGAQKSRLQEMFERRMLNDGIKSEEEWEEMFSELDVPSYPCFLTAAVVLDLRILAKTENPKNPATQINEDAICLRVLDEMPAELASYCWMIPIYNSSVIFCMLGADNEDELLKNTMEFHDKLQKFVFELTGFHVLMGVSNTTHDHRHVKRAYRQSVNAITSPHMNVEDEEFSEDTEGTPKCRFFIQQSPSERGESYSNNFENDVHMAIKEVDRHKAYQLTDRFCEHLATVSNIDIATLYIVRYVNSIILTGLESNISPEVIFPEGIRHAYRELMSEIEPRRIRKYIKKTFIDPISDILTEKMQNDSYSIMESIDRLMEETKGNILLAECADALGVHQTYIWKILKMEKGKSFTEYAEKYKIEEAKRLLLQTNMSVQEIAAFLDYANAQNFIRFFSKITGVTPGKFRKIY